MSIQANANHLPGLELAWAKLHAAGYQPGDAPHTILAQAIASAAANPVEPAVAMPPEISRDLLGKIVDEVFDGAIEDPSVIEDVHRVIAREYRAAPAVVNQQVTTADLTSVRCQCCQAEHAADSYDAGFIAGSGMCQVCDSAMPPKDLPAAVSTVEEVRRLREALEQIAAGERIVERDGHSTVENDATIDYPSIAIAALSAQQSAQDDEYPPCDYCRRELVYHPWHGSGLFQGVESRHIHACDECRHLLPSACGLQAAVDQLAEIDRSSAARQKRIDQSLAQQSAQDVSVPRELVERLVVAERDCLHGQFEVAMDELRALLNGGEA